MAKRLSQLTNKEFKAQLSIAGDPDKVMEIKENLEDLMNGRLNTHNIAELENMCFALDKIKADLKNWISIERNRQHPKH